MGTKQRTYVDVMALHDRVTGSCNFLVVKMPTKETFRIVVDCGLFRGEDEEVENSSEGNKNLNDYFPFNVEKLDYVFVTHNHTDHIGRLPYLVKQQYSGYIYCSPTTKKLIPLALGDSFRLTREEHKKLHTPMPYTYDDVEETIKKVKEIEYDKTFELNRYIKVTFLRNGHLPGAAMILFQIQFMNEEPINLLFTGDYNNKNLFYKVPKIPKWLRKMPVTIIQESTYGTTDSYQIVKCFRSNIRRQIKKNGTVVIPVFSLGRCQEVLKTIRDMQDRGKIDSNIPVYVDGNLAINYTLIYLSGQIDIDEGNQDFLPHNTRFVDKGSREHVAHSRESKIIITSSGSASFGPAPYYLRNYLVDPNALIHFTGYLFEDSTGRRIKETPDGEPVRIGGRFVEKCATIKATSEFSAHAKADEMLDFLKKFTNLNAVLINHGEPETKEAFAERIRKENCAKQVEVLNSKNFVRISPWGITKILPTHFKIA